MDRQVRRELPEIRARKVRAAPVARLALTVVLVSLDRRETAARRGHKARQVLQGLQGSRETGAPKARAVRVEKLGQRAAAAPTVTLVRWDRRVRREVKARKARAVRVALAARPVPRVAMARWGSRVTTVLQAKQVHAATPGRLDRLGRQEPSSLGTRLATSSASELRE